MGMNDRLEVLRRRRGALRRGPLHLGRTLRLAASTVLALVALVGGARADMVLSDVIVDLQAPSEMRHDVDVRNDGEETLYVEVGVHRVPDPARDSAARVPETDPRTAGLLASPRRLAIPPGERKRVRIVAREVPTVDDLVYRVAFVPKENEAKTNEAMAFKVLIGYEVLVLVRPADARPELVVERAGRKLHVENRGHSSLLVRQLEQCDPDDAKRCEELPGNRLYAGEVWDVELPWDAPVRMHRTYRLENSVTAH
jgi:P pilus assembly chaperone PapD